MFIKGVFIGGFMIGFEYLWDNKIFVIDLGILRIYFGVIPQQQ
jgi:hypothetical protein